MSTDQPDGPTADQPERLDLRSADPLAERIAVLRETFPEAFREGKIDVDVLTRSLGEWVDPGPERFGLTWPGKAECMRVIQEPSVGTLVPMPEESVDWETTQNVIIEGENLEVLKLLQKAYYGKVKMIYIDPPYNTGKEFIYPDNFKEGLADYLKYSGQVDDAGFKVSANTDTDGRYHSKWLSMMYPRLFLARNLLRDDGVIFVSIDDHEVHNLRALMNEIFGEEKFVACLTWQKRYSRENRGSIGDAHEYILIYARDPARFQSTRGLISPTEKQTAVYKNSNNDPRGRWRPVPMTAQGFRANQMYEITTPSGAKHRPPEGRCWGMIEPEFEKLRGIGRIYFGKDGSSQPNVIRYLDELEGLVPWTWWPADESGHTDEARKEVQQIFGTQSAFDTPKPTRLIKRILEIGAADGGIIVDFFAGSGTLAQAVYELSDHETTTPRQFVLVQLPQDGNEVDKQGIAALARTRARRSSQTAQERGEDHQADPRDLGFRAFKLTASGFNTWAAATSRHDLVEQLLLTEQNIIPQATDSSLLVELTLKLGYPLPVNVTSEVIAKAKVHFVNDGTVAIFLDGEVDLKSIEAVANRRPAMIVMFERVFSHDDQLKVNCMQTVRAFNQREGSDITLRVV